MGVFRTCDSMLLPLQKWTMDHAARNGYLEVIKCLHENRQEEYTTYFMVLLIGRMVRRLLPNGYLIGIYMLMFI